MVLRNKRSLYKENIACDTPPSKRACKSTSAKKGSPEVRIQELSPNGSDDLTGDLSVQYGSPCAKAVARIEHAEEYDESMEESSFDSDVNSSRPSNDDLNAKFQMAVQRFNELEKRLIQLSPKTSEPAKAPIR
ncbi:hypothetical protein TRICI_001520 [Trichomonascus ciferrii]|uniref:Uncharacterized protein n=1 Tax=Trichomonascus ciferrii TaxID=44093 RepID=A0A642V895_9ASCO|nr:hypothetical protein TRICI_001520 [Trichomonascus ciferrii]